MLLRCPLARLREIGSRGREGELRLEVRRRLHLMASEGLVGMGRLVAAEVLMMRLGPVRDVTRLPEVLQLLLGVLLLLLLLQGADPIRDAEEALVDVGKLLRVSPVVD